MRSIPVILAFCLSTTSLHAGDWKQVVADPDNFSADCGSWSVPPGSLVNARYKIVEANEVQLIIHAEATSVAAATNCSPSTLKWRLPEGKVTASEFLTPIILSQNGSYEVGFAQAPAAGLQDILLMRLAGTWSISEERTYVWGQISVPVKPSDHSNKTPQRKAVRFAN